jgi:hypothetical protein
MSLLIACTQYEFSRNVAREDSHHSDHIVSLRGGDRIDENCIARIEFSGEQYLSLFGHDEAVNRDAAHEAH